MTQKQKRLNDTKRPSNKMNESNPRATFKPTNYMTARAKKTTTDSKTIERLQTNHSITITMYKLWLNTETVCYREPIITIDN